MLSIPYLYEALATKKEEIVELLYEQNIRIQKGIIDYLPIIKKISINVEKITEIGCNYGFGVTLLFLLLKPKRFITYDFNNRILKLLPIMKEYARINKFKFEFRNEDFNKIIIEPTSLLFINSTTDEHCKNILKNNHNVVSDFIILFNTVSRGINGSFGRKGVKETIVDFLVENSDDWDIFKDYSEPETNGLLILQRCEHKNEFRN